MNEDSDTMRKQALIIKTILEPNPHAKTMSKVFAALAHTIRRHEWEGACHATTAIAYVLLRSYGVDDCLACLGEVRVRADSHIYFDHSWIEQDGMPLDVSIAVPLPTAVICSSGVVKGIELSTGGPSQLVYGVSSGAGLGPEAKFAVSGTVGRFMDGSVGVEQFPADGLWAIAKEVAGYAGLPFHAEAVREAGATGPWATR